MRLHYFRLVKKSESDILLSDSRNGGFFIPSLNPINWRPFLLIGTIRKGGKNKNE